MLVSADATNQRIAFAAGLATGAGLAAIAQRVFNQVTGHGARTLSEATPLEKAKFMNDLEKDWTLSTKGLTKITNHFVSELRRGLTISGQAERDDPEVAPNKKPMPCVVSYCPRPTGRETGSFLALDLGGTNFRVCEVVLEGKGQSRVRQKKFTVSDEVKKSDGRVLCDFLAASVANALSEWGYDFQDEAASKIKLGYTFSFPCKQLSLAHGLLLFWTKGFSCSNMVGNDVVAMLQESLERQQIRVQVAALANDTVGTLLAHAYRDPETLVGLILGTGCNAAYVENVRDIEKYEGNKRSGEMIVNIEWGGFDNACTVLPVTKYDRLLDQNSTHIGQQIFEKMIAGMYLGELTRLVLVDMLNHGIIYATSYGKRDKSSRFEKLFTKESFETAYMSRVERDHSIDLADTKIVLEDLMDLPPSTIEDRHLVKRVCQLVGTRSARLAACGVAGVLIKINKLDGATVGVDGSLFEHYPHYSNRMRDALAELLPIAVYNINLDLARDGSGLGAAIAASL